MIQPVDIVLNKGQSCIGHEQKRNAIMDKCS